MAEPQALYLLLAPSGQLSGNGQLRETLRDRRSRKGEDVPFWYLSPELVQKFELGEQGFEAVLASELTAINWLKLRFGGKSTSILIDIDQLKEHARGLPPGPTIRDISV